MKILDSDSRYIKQAIEGDRRAFECIVKSYKDKVFRICYSYTNSVHDAEDIAQDAFVEVYKSMGTFNQQSSVSTWIYRIASNKAIDHIRKHKRKKRDTGVLNYLDDDQNTFEIEAEGSAAEDIISQQRRKFLYQGLNKLPERQKKAFVLTQIEGMTHKEVAEIMQTTVKSIEVLVVRGRKKLKQVLEKQIQNYL